MKRHYQRNTATDVVNLLNDLIEEDGSVTVVSILKPGTPISEVSLIKNTNKTTMGYVVKVEV